MKFGELLYGARPMQLSSGVQCDLYVFYARSATISGSLIVSVK